MAKENGVKIAVDLQDICDINDPYRRDFIEAADFLFFSAANQADPRPIIEELLKRNPRQIVVSGMGAQGCMLGSSSGIQHFPAVQLDLPVIDTNGAGDSLAVGFLSSILLEGCSIEDSIRRGQIAARYCCAQKASSSHLIRKEQLIHYLYCEAR